MEAQQKRWKVERDKAEIMAREIREALDHEGAYLS